MTQHLKGNKMAQQNEFEYFDSVNKFANENQSIKTKQSAIEWLHYLYKEGILIEKSFEIAKELEKRQIKFAYNDGAENMVSGKYKGMEDYYNEKYEKWLKD
jgi:hypothetical protein